jgi:hypothetical protein
MSNPTLRRSAPSSNIRYAARRHAARAAHLAGTNGDPIHSEQGILLPTDIAASHSGVGSTYQLPQLRTSGQRVIPLDQQAEIRMEWDAQVRKLTYY